MSALDRMLPDDATALLQGLERFMVDKVAPRVLAAEAADVPDTELLAAAGSLELTELLTTEELGDPLQRAAMLAACGRTLARTDAGVAMAITGSAVTAAALGNPTGLAVVIARADGAGAAGLTGQHPRTVLLGNDGSCRLIELPIGEGDTLWGLRLGGARLHRLPPSQGEPLLPLQAAALRTAVVFAAVAVALGTGEGALRTATDYAGERYQGGDVIAKHYAVQQLLAEMEDQLAVADSHLATLAGLEPTATSLRPLARAAFAACEAAITSGVQVLGGYGYMQEYGQEKRMRDARTLRLLFAP